MSDIDPVGGHEGQGAPGLDLGALLSQVGQMQQHLADAQQQAADTVVVGTAGGGAVRIEVTGGMEFQSVVIDPAAVDAAHVGDLEDLVLAALRDASDRVQHLQEQALGDAGLGGLSGLLGD